jgi:hypothetical protein
MLCLLPLARPFPTNANPRPPIHHQMMVARMAFGTLNFEKKENKIKYNGIFLLFRPAWLEKGQLQVSG